MTIVLHIGVSKTGSSAIQYALAQHRETLSARGLHYALRDAEEVVEKRLITSGNGSLLARRLDPRRATPEAEALEFDTAFVSDAHAISLVSSEGLSSADPEALGRFNEQVIAGRKVRIVAFVRDLYGHAIASWMQIIKRRGYTGRFEAFCAKTYTNKQYRALKTFEEVFGREQIDVIHYDSLEQSVFHALLAVVGVPGDDLAPPPKVNRSLTRTETEVLIACNRIHGDVKGLSARISDHMIYKHPDRPRDTVRSPRAAALLAEQFQGEIDWINQAYFGGRPVLTVGAPEQAPEEGAIDREEVWADAVEALGRRLIAVEAISQQQQAGLDAIPAILRQRDALRDEVERLKAQSSFDKLRTEVARTFKGKGAARAPED